MIRLILLMFAGVANAGDMYVSAAVNPFRSESYSLSAGWTPLGNEQTRVGVELLYDSFGEQPTGYENLNRAAGIGLVGFSQVSDKVGVFGRIGANNTEFSRNGTNYYDRSDDNLWGWYGGAGVEYLWRPNIRSFIQATVHQYRQVNNGEYGGYTHATAGLRFIF